MRTLLTKEIEKNTTIYVLNFRPYDVFIYNFCRFLIFFVSRMFLLLKNKI